MTRFFGLALAMLPLAISPAAHAAVLSYDLEGDYANTQTLTDGVFAASVSIDTASSPLYSPHAPNNYDFPIVSGSFTVGSSTYTADPLKSTYSQSQTSSEQSFSFDLVDDSGDSLDQVFTLFPAQSAFPLALSVCPGRS